MKVTTSSHQMIHVKIYHFNALFKNPKHTQSEKKKEMMFLILFVQSISSSSKADQLRTLLNRYKDTDKAKWTKLVQFLEPQNTLRSKTGKIDIQKMLLEARGMSPERAETTSTIKSLKEMETKLKLQKWMNNEFSAMMRSLYHKMRNRIEARKNYVEQLYFNSYNRFPKRITRKQTLDKKKKLSTTTKKTNKNLKKKR
ncbi:hypothetical protein TRFO_08596 [Tritrichomonas foetus]|uniref:Uncharacterized protein n=1 Tax=Tritrichomonas foetus TaxID=1144522 RepID=A0A1J4JIM1_9EUKA|nr:hypothetical protein TRFO_08596 [Tritrichomonas foetus]|eukprot:OHS99040.1 hypothetical protein TRFO_08596 [Tritrichomonas foetus]